MPNFFRNINKYLFDTSYYYRYFYLLKKNGFKKILNIDDWMIMPQIEFEIVNKNSSIKREIDMDLLRKISQNNKRKVNYEKLFKDNLTTSLLIFKNGKIIYEKYSHGFSENSIQRILSVSKIYISALIGILLKKGRINNIDDPIGKYLPNIKNEFLSEKTIRELLLMDGGVDYSEGNYPWNHWCKFNFSPNIDKILKQVKTNNKSGNYFHYNNFYSCTLVQLIKKLTNNNFIEFLKSEILSPIGCNAKFSINIDSYQNKFEKLDMGLNCTPISLLKMGMLYLNDGIVNGKVVLSKDWIRDSTSFNNSKNNRQDKNQYLGENIRPLFLGKMNTYFKYYWWGYQKSKLDYDFFSLGKLGQIMYINKSKKVILIRTGKKWTNKISLSEIAYQITNSV